jgi:hypothetical protein
MEIPELIEQIIVKEIKGLCSSCAYAHDCLYQKVTTKAIIQCEMFELELEGETVLAPTKGLCKSCDHASECKLPGRIHGVWHCNEFQ